MNITLLSHSDLDGGAARATHRLHTLLKRNNIRSKMLVRKKLSDDESIICPNRLILKTLNNFRAPIGRLINNLQKSDNTYLHSGNWLPSFWSEQINQSDADLINLHWIAGETLSFRDLSLIKKPLVWTLHDMWAFCGAEHLSQYTPYARWKTGYNRNNRNTKDSGLDIDRYVWQRKRKYISQDMSIITPSNWLKNCASQSALLCNNDISVIPNAIDLETFKIIDQALCKHILNIPQATKVILFGAVHGSKDPNKGFDLLKNALHRLRHIANDSHILCIVFGQSEPEIAEECPFPIRWMGHLSDDYTLALLYNAASVTVVPSRLENLPQLATEAQSCGCPVVAFNVGGIPDAVDHLITGYLATPLDPIDLANGILWALNDKTAIEARIKARLRALNLWSPRVIYSKYMETYTNVIEKFKLSQ